MILSLIAAVAQNRVIGRNNDLPWRLPDDMKYFMETTQGHKVIMGRRNYDSLPAKFKPLPKRENFVITRQPGWQAPGCTVINSWEEAKKKTAGHPNEEVFVIGGAEIYSLALPDAQRLYLTEIQTQCEGDVYFPPFDPRQWREVSRKPHPTDSRHAFAFDFVVYERQG